MIRACLLFIAVAAYGVTPVAVGSLLQHKANFFDLAHKRIRFTPRKTLNEYKLFVTSATRTLETGSLLGVKDDFDPKAKSWTVRLPFAFPFGGRTWTELYVNLNGNITFGAPETPQYPQRHSWSDGTMRSVAAWADTGTLSGRYMIAPLWAMYSADSTVST